MATGVFNLFVGAVGVILGLTGRYSCLGSDDPMILVAVGAGISSLGLYQIIQSRRR